MPEKMMHRHKSFGSPGEALDYLYGMAPALFIPLLLIMNTLMRGK
jgi:DNA primase catalytic subunit